MTVNKEQLTNDLLFQVSVTDPLEKIISKLQKNEYRDIDIQYLKRQLEKFTAFALKTINLNLVIPEMDYPHLNDFVKGQFLGYFETLLKYFRKLWKDAE